MINSKMFNKHHSIFITLKFSRRYGVYWDTAPPIFIRNSRSPKSIDNASTRNQSCVSEYFDGVFSKEEERNFTEMFRKHDYSHADVRSVYILYIPRSGALADKCVQ